MQTSYALPDRGVSLWVLKSTDDLVKLHVVFVEGTSGDDHTFCLLGEDCDTLP